MAHFGEVVGQGQKSKRHAGPSVRNFGYLEMLLQLSLTLVQERLCCNHCILTIDPSLKGVRLLCCFTPSRTGRIMVTFGQ